MTEEVQPAPAPAGKSPRKLIVMFAAVVVIEAALIIGVMSVLGGPAEVHADHAVGPVIDDENQKAIELPVLKGRMANDKSGMTYIFDTEIYVQTRKKHEDRVKGELERFQNEIKAEVTAIWRTSEPHHFREPKLENLTRKVYALLNDRFGNDGESGEPIISKCVIVMGTGFRVDG
jgi:hypothetical protein